MGQILVCVVPEEEEAAQGEDREASEHGARASASHSGLGRTYSAGSARGKIAVLTSLSFRKVEGKDRGGYVFCRGREGYSDARGRAAGVHARESHQHLQLLPALATDRRHQ